MQHPTDDDQILLNEPDEIDETLAGLRGLIEKVTSPVVRACLEEAHDDIAHLNDRTPLRADADEMLEAA